MAILALTPREGKTCKAKITGESGLPFIADLPKVQNEGYTLGLNNSQPASIYVKVAVINKFYNTHQNAAFYLVAQSQGKPCYTSQGTLAGPVFSFKIEKSRFPSGIV